MAARITRTLYGLEQFIQNDNDNPYAPPVNTGHRISKRAFVRRRRTGPTLYVALLGLTGGLFSPAVMENHFGIALLFPTVGCIAGAMIYRYRSSAWPIDPTAFRRALFCSAALAVVPATMAIVTQLHTQWYGFVAIIAAVMLPFALGLLAAGPRRDGVSEEA